MKILLIADEEAPFLWDHYQPGRLDGIDLILSCGDLKQEYLEFLVTMSNKPLFYVHGNHDKGYVSFPPEGCECLDDMLISVHGLRIMGLGGCMRYNPGPFQYTEKEMTRRVKRMRRYIKRAGGVDVVITHAPPMGFGDAPDNAHRGFASFLPLMDEFHPRYLIHGHVHQSYGYNLPRTFQYGDTTIMNAVGWHILEIDPPEQQPKRGLFHWLHRQKNQY